MNNNRTKILKRRRDPERRASHPPRLWACLGVLAVMALNSFQAQSQGCVIARGGGQTMVMSGDGFLEAGQWQASLAYRWLHSDRHFVGRKEQPQRQKDGTEVINDQHFFDLTATYAVTKRVGVNLTVPFVHNRRSSLYEHDRVNRHSTGSGGMGDIRLTGNYWLFNPETCERYNVSVGAGIKAPTGDYKATDTFQRPGGPEIRYVDSSIQPGDGGWGAILETQGYFNFTHHFSAYMNGAYLFNPRNEVGDTGFSVPDSYLGRAGLSYAIWPSQGLSLSFGGRIEGVPPEDAIGGSDGRRRPGYAISVEPGLTLVRGKFFATVTTPVAVERNRQRTAGAATTGDAAFADFTVNASFAWRF